MSKPGPSGLQPPPDGPATPQGPVTAPTTTATESTGTHYESPPSGATAGVFAVPAVSQAADDMGWVPSAVLDVKAQLEEQLSQATSATATAQDAGAFTGIANVQAVAIGVNGGDTTAAAVPGSPCLVVYVAEPAPDEQVHDMAAQAAGVSSQALTADVPIKVVRVGIVEAQPHRFRLRQAPAGVSVGHVRITAGTIGCFVTGRSAPRSNRMLMLSNNHVLANVNSAAAGDVIIQPGPVDGGSSPSDQVAMELGASPSREFADLVGREEVSTPHQRRGQVSCRQGESAGPPAEVILKAVSGGLHPLQERPVGQRDLQAPGSPRSP
jgi:hypothetical protein